MATRKTKSSRSKTTTKPTKSAKTTSPAKKTSSVKSSRSLPSLGLSRASFKPSSLRIRRSYLLLGLAVVIVAVLAVFFKNLFIVATVNGQPITRLTYMQELEQLSGTQAMNSLVTKTLILQEAKKQNVTVSDQEVNDEIKKIEDNLTQQGQKLDSVLELQGMTREALIEQVRLQKLIEKMVGKDVKVEDKEIEEYITQNQESLPQETEPEELKKQVSEQLRQQKLNEKVQAWLQNLQQNAKIQNWLQK